MIISEFFGRQTTPTVLALVTIATVNILSGEANAALRPFHQAEQAHHGGKTDGETHRANSLVVLLDHLHLSQKKESDRLFPVDDFQRLVGDIQQQNLFHTRAPAKR
jgi:hypothetical protein